jgi:hypothetical protein
MLSMVSHTLKLVILGGKLTSVKKIIAGGQTTVDPHFGPPFWTLNMDPHHAEGLVNPKVRALKKGY